ncbi:PAQR family membrane homeostasis protein TrhA [Terribacillus saccharophilus]|uniref:Hemolysin D n=1 Tax=Terribacillus saccharophilus TaxID=361277 RepID=A0A075LHU1_9BACI|nr:MULTISPECIES: hemolysin III family protein [Terribacillus]AIF66225.1 hemolysin D [Terribacillus goriensis]MCM3225083.1 hemolysin III family protein [Terribacillus saccharophilus]MEC0282996.1 hemolysin III family protein [Terribacillus saccharophilus]MEC0289953.1 hemolysin III family protein [Terribacillus saccharophilus]SEM79227.1 hemolysin III [Terribacillus saccharophilus]
METYIFTKKEEAAHSITHGFGALLSIAALVVAVVLASFTKDPWIIVSVTIYGTTMLLMYLSSTIVHALPEGKVKDIFQIIDHAAIYLFIAGTYTPLLLIGLRSSLGWTIFGIVWGIALGGIIFKIFFVKKFLIMSTVFYLLMGWMIVLVWEPMLAALPQLTILYLVIGGLFYTIGAVFYVWRKIPYHHAVWHLFVLAGSAFHFFAILFII